MRRILIVGSGGREHALAKCFHKSVTVEKVFVAPGNAGMGDVATIVPIEVMDFNKLINFSKTEHIDLVFVGPEAPLSAGIADAMKQAGIRVFGPSAKAAQLEASKSFAKQLMNQYNIPTAKHVTVFSKEEAMNNLSSNPSPIVIKADGLMAGKGVTVAMDDKTAIAAVEDIYRDISYGPLVIEEFLEGEEFSLMAFVNHEKVFPLEIARDYKRAFDYDEGLNTGGMGAFSPVPFIKDEWVAEAMNNIMIPMAKAMVNQGIPFTGMLYGGLMATKDGVKTIEFNVRFGDPEAEVLLARLLTPLDQIVFDVMDGKDVELTFDPRFALGVVMASRGYPQSYVKNTKIKNLESLSVDVCHMGTDWDDGWVNRGGRVLFVMDLAQTLEKVRETVYKEIARIDAPGLFYRSDIGQWKEVQI
jgi:phosphoribosylamine---glycine ligase